MMGMKMTIRYTQEDWEGVQDAAEGAFIVLRREVANGDILFIQRAAVTCKAEIEACVTVAASLGISYDGAADFDALRDLAWQGICNSSGPLGARASDVPLDCLGLSSLMAEACPAGTLPTDQHSA